MQVRANSQLSFVFFIPYVYIIVFIFSFIWTLDYPDYLLKSHESR